MENYFLRPDLISFQDQPLDFFVLSEVEKNHILTKKGFHNQLTYAILLKYFESERRFPEGSIELLPHAYEILVNQLDVPFEKLKWPTERTLIRFRASIREFLGYRKMSLTDKTDLSSWLSKNILPLALDEDALFEATEFFCHHHKIELFAKGEMKRFLVKTSNIFEENLLNNVAQSLSHETKKVLDGILEEHPDNDNNEGDVLEFFPKKKFILSDFKKDMSHLKKESILYEISKYDFLKSINLPEKLADTHSRKLLLKYATYVKTRVPSDLRAQEDLLRYGQLALFFTVKSQQSADTLTDFLLKILHRIERRAEQHVDRYVLSEIKKVKGKFYTLLTLAETLKSNPKGIIEQTIYPKVPITELEAIIKELHHGEKWYQNQVRVKALSLYNHGYRKLLKDLLRTLTFETDRKDLRELLLAIEWVKKDESEREIDNLPYQENILKSCGSVVQKGTQDKTNIVIEGRAFELAILENFSKELSVKNIWVKGAHQYQNPSKDMPSDFEEKKDFYFDFLELPKEADDFVASLKNKLEESLLLLNETIPNNEKVRLIERKKGAIKLSPSSPQDLPTNLEALHQEISRLWPNVPLIDILKEVDFRVGFTKNFEGLGTRSVIPKDILQKRLLFCLYGLGSNIGLKRLVTSHTGESYADLRYVKNRYLSAQHIRAAIQDIINAILEMRDPKIWGENIIGCACDSKRFNVWVQNMVGGWHGRYRSHGVMVYTHIDTKSAPIYMQITRPGDSEVGSMLTGCLRHDTEMDMSEIYTDTHGQSSLGFAFSYLLHFDLLPRIKGIHKQKFFSPTRSFKEKLPHLKLALASDPINWGKIEGNYEEFVKYTAALKTRTVDARVLLKRLSADNATHPAYQALLEIGKAVRTIFLCRYLQEENLRIQINETLNVVERFNGMMGFIFHGKQGEISTNDKEDQELSILCLHLIQVCITYMNTLMIQEVLKNPLKPYSLTIHDRRAINPMFYGHLNPHGIVSLNMTKRLNFKISKPPKIKAV
jgi:TnpA family transposase